MEDRLHLYFKEVLQDHVRPFTSSIGENVLFMHDKSKAYVVQSVTQYLNKFVMQTLQFQKAT